MKPCKAENYHYSHHENKSILERKIPIYKLKMVWRCKWIKILVLYSTYKNVND